MGIATLPETSRIWLLALPSAAILFALVWHSLLALPRRIAAAAWISLAAYGIVRGLAVRWISADVLGGSVPYRMATPLGEWFGVSLQEVAGWCLIGYLAWWLGVRLASHGDTPPGAGKTLLWSCLVLGAASLAIETAAVALGWWSWSVPARSALFGAVPAIGVVDWFFVGSDVLLPLIFFTAPGSPNRARWLSLLAFPAHFAAHAAPAPFGATSPWLLEAAHWTLLAALVWLALRGGAEGSPFGLRPAARRSWLPLAAGGALVADLAVADVLAARGPVQASISILIASLAPLAVLLLLAVSRPLGLAAAAASACAGLAVPVEALGALPGALSVALPQRRAGAAVAAAAAASVLATGLVSHLHGAGRRERLLRGLDAALAARDAGDLGSAERRLAELAAGHPGEHAPRALLAEILERRGETERAATLYREVLASKPDFVPAHRALAAQALVRGERDAAAAAARRGLAIAPGDPALGYVAARAAGEDASPLWARLSDSAEAQEMAVLAERCGDAAGAASALEAALARWPEDRELYPARVRLAAAAGDAATAVRVTIAWRARFPDDARALEVARRLQLSD